MSPKTIGIIGFDGLPVFSPDGKRLSWTNGRTGDGKAQIFLADWNDAAAQQAIAEAPKRAGEKDQASAPLSPQITKADLQHEVEWLADEKRDGRMTGTAGAQASAAWLTDYFGKRGSNLSAPVSSCHSNSMPANACSRKRRTARSLWMEARRWTRCSNSISGRSLSARMGPPKRK